MTAANNPGSCDSNVRWESIPFFQAAKPANPCPTIPKHLSGYSSTFVEVVLILKVSGILRAKIHILASKNTTFEGTKIETIQHPRMWVLAHRGDRWLNFEEIQKGMLREVS